MVVVPEVGDGSQTVHKVLDRMQQEVEGKAGHGAMGKLQTGAEDKMVQVVEDNMEVCEDEESRETLQEEVHNPAEVVEEVMVAHLSYMVSRHQNHSKVSKNKIFCLLIVIRDILFF